MQLLTDPSTAQYVEQVKRVAFWDGVSQWGYTLWFVGFVVGVLLLLLFAIVPRENFSPVLIPEGPRSGLSRLSRFRPLMLHLGGVLILILCAISHQTNVDQMRGMSADQDKRYEESIKKISAGGHRDAALRSQYMYVPTGNSLIYMSLGNPSLAADYMWLTSQQYVVNSFRRGQKYEMLLRFYNTVLELDPNWIEAAIKGGKVLSALEPNRYAVEKFYTEAISKNPGDIELPYEAGRLFVVPPPNLELRKEFAKHATDWFSLVIDLIKKLPADDERERRIKSVQDLISRMAVETDAYELAAEMLWKNMHDDKSSKALRQISARDWLNARSLVIQSKLQKRVDDYRAQHFFAPPHLRDIIASLAGEKNLFVELDEGGNPRLDRNGMPRDAFGYPIDYNPATGRVLSRGVAAKQAIQAAAIISSLIAAYRQEHGGAAPKDLNELQKFVKSYFAIQGNEATSSMTNSLGMDLNVIMSPFGTPWNYNAQDGKIELPPECNPKLLFKKAESLVPQ